MRRRSVKKSNGLEREREQDLHPLEKPYRVAAGIDPEERPRDRAKGRSLGTSRRSSLMTLMLASVTGAEEAEIAVRHGTDIIDLKDVGSAFGAVAPDVIRATVNSVARRRPVSAVAGELEMTPAIIAQAVAAVADAGAEYVKIGLFPGHRRDESIRALTPLARRVRLIGVMFADCGADDDLIALLAQSGFAGVMIDVAK
jgi:hypothetical protein